MSSLALLKRQEIGIGVVFNLFHSFHLVSALVDDNQILFYNIYEKFDKLNIFNSNFSDSALKTETPTPCKPPDTL